MALHDADARLTTAAGYTRRVGRTDNGSGTLRWVDRSQRWELRVQVDGVRRSEFFSVSAFGSKQRAEIAAKRRRRVLAGEAAAGLLVLARDMPLDEFVDRFIERQTHLEEATKQEYRGRLKHLLRLFPGKGIRALESGDQVAWFFGRLRDEKYSPKMIAHVRYVVGLVLDLAAVQGYIKRNPIRAERIKTPTVDPREYRLFRAPEVFAMLDAPDVQGTPLEALIALMGLSALRPGEAIGLRWADLDGEWLRVRTSGRRQTTKTAAGRRRIKLPARVMDTVAALEASRPMGEDRLFPGMTVKALDGRLHRLQRRLGIAPPGRPYDLRHTAITHAIAYAQTTPGVSIADVARWAGHRRNSTTLDTYCHVLDSSPGLADVMAEAYRVELARLGETIDDALVATPPATPFESASA